MATDKQKNAIIAACAAIYEAIRDLKGVPSGHLYARLMGSMTLDQYESLIGILIKQGLVKRDSMHYLTAVEVK